MKTRSSRWTAALLIAGGIASSIGCYPVYPPSGYNGNYNQDSKGYSVPQEPAPQPVRYGVDPGLVVAGVAAAGLLGYAIADHHGYHNHYYYGPGPGYYYRPVPYGRYYYGPRYHP